MQVVGCVTESVAPDREQPVPVFSNEIAPVPDPPEVVNVTVRFAGLVRVALLIFKLL